MSTGTAMLVGTVISHRRQLSAGQRAMIAQKVANVPHRRDDTKIGIPILLTREEAAVQLSTTPDAISNARLINEWVPDEAVEVEAGKMSFVTFSRLRLISPILTTARSLILDISTSSSVFRARNSDKSCPAGVLQAASFNRVARGESAVGGTGERGLGCR
jgi:hypothetical protein